MAMLCFSNYFAVDLFFICSVIGRYQSVQHREPGFQSAWADVSRSVWSKIARQGLVVLVCNVWLYYFMTLPVVQLPSPLNCMSTRQQRKLTSIAHTTCARILDLLALSLTSCQNLGSLAGGPRPYPGPTPRPRLGQFPTVNWAMDVDMKIFLLSCAASLLASSLRFSKRVLAPVTVAAFALSLHASCLSKADVLRCEMSGRCFYNTCNFSLSYRLSCCILTLLLDGVARINTAMLTRYWAVAYAAPVAGYVLCTSWPFQIRTVGCAGDVFNQLPLQVGIIAFVHSRDASEFPRLRSPLRFMKSNIRCMEFIFLEAHVDEYLGCLCPEIFLYPAKFATRLLLVDFPVKILWIYVISHLVHVAFLRYRHSSLQQYQQFS
jgi:hypothetical protein